jgi:hypothetical protein
VDADPDTNKLSCAPLAGAGRTTRYLLIADVTSDDKLAAPVLLNMPESRMAIA